MLASNIRRMTRVLNSSLAKFRGARQLANERKPLFAMSDFDIPIEQIRKCPPGWKDAMLAMGRDPYEKPIRQTPHYEALLQFAEPLETCADSDYVKYQMLRRGYGRKQALNRLEWFRQIAVEIRCTERFDPIWVLARADGVYSIVDGTHRTAIAMALGKETIPGRIVDTDGHLAELLQDAHDDWPENERQLYEPIEHPAFADWPAQVDPGYGDTISKADIEWSGCNVLVAGSRTGYLSRIISRHGGIVTGCEIKATRRSIAERLNRLLDTPVAYLQCDYREVLRRREFDVVVCSGGLLENLNNHGWDDLRESLNIIFASTPTLAIDCACENKDTWLKLAADNSAYKKHQRLVHDGTGRRLYVIQRSSDPVAAERCPSSNDLGQIGA